MLTGTLTHGATAPTTLPLHRESAADAIVLAGTVSWRRTPFDALLPRPLLPVAQLPLIGYTLRWTALSGARRVTVCGNGLTALIREQLRSHRATLPPIDYSEDRSPRGAAGAARDAALATAGDLFVVADATTIPDVQLDRVIDEHRRRGAALTIVVQPSSPASSRDQHALVPTGLYIFSRRAFDAVPDTGYQDIKEALIPRLYAAGELVTTTEADGTCPRVLDAHSYLGVNHWMIARLAAQRSSLPRPGCEQAILHPSARISRSALLIGPVLVDAGAEIQAGATIVGPTAIGARSVVAAGAVVSRSVVWERCSIAAGALVDRTVLASDVAVAAGARFANAVCTAPQPRVAAANTVAPQSLPEIQPGLPIGGLALH